MDSPAKTPTGHVDFLNIRFVLLLVAAITATTAGCDSVDVPVGTGPWLIPSTEVFDGGPGKDGIPSIDRPQFASVSATNYVGNNRLVIGVRVGDVVRAYPHQVLDWHEIVNESIGGVPIAITYCPLTGTGISWNRSIGGTVTEFGVSGLLFRNNLIAYDRATDSNWSQMQLRGVQGTLAATDAETILTIETTWATWRQMYPESQVLTTATGFQRNYSGFAYGERYLTDHDRILFPVKNRDPRLRNKERVHGVIASLPADEEADVRVYPISAFGSGVRLIQDSVGGDAYIIVGSSDKNFAAAFRHRLADGSQPDFQPVQDALPVVLQDAEGNRWDVFGVAVDGHRAGERLIPARAYTGYWFAWADFFPGLEIYEE